VTADYTTLSDTAIPGFPPPSAGAVTFFLPAGLLHFSIAPPSPVGIASITGSGIVNLTSGMVAANFHTSWIVHFGLLIPLNFVVWPFPPFQPYAGAPWSVSLLPAVQHGGPAPLLNSTNGTPPAGTNVTTVGFLVPTGAVYRYSITGPGPEYKLTPSQGRVRAGESSSVNGTTIPVKFHLLTSKVVFKESGLPRGTNWTVAITGGTSPVFHYPFSEVQPGPPQAVFRLPAGTYTWVAVAVGFTAPVSSGTLTVSYPAPATIVKVEFGSAGVGCFVFTNDGVPLGGPTCNPNANDILVNFDQLPGAVCANQFTLGGAALGAAVTCPVTAVGNANQLEVNWTGSSSGLVVTSCYWAVSGTPVGTCPVPSSPSPDGFVLFLAGIASVSWTVNGQVVGAALPAPPGTNGVEFFL